MLGIVTNATTAVNGAIGGASALLGGADVGLLLLVAVIAACATHYYFVVLGGAAASLRAGRAGFTFPAGESVLGAVNRSGVLKVMWNPKTTFPGRITVLVAGPAATISPQIRMANGARTYVHNARRGRSSRGGTSRYFITGQDGKKYRLSIEKAADMAYPVALTGYKKDEAGYDASHVDDSGGTPITKISAVLATGAPHKYIATWALGTEKRPIAKDRMPK
jgi:hypothetical protein